MLQAIDIDPAQLAASGVKARTPWISAVVMALGLYMAAMIAFAVPVNVDESVQYHPIACTAYPLARYHTFWNACDDSNSLVFLGTHLPRAYAYIGGFSSVLYWPFFKLHPSIGMQRIVGMFFLIACVLLVTLLEREHQLSIWVLFGLSFPLMYQLVDDTGPVRFGLFMMLFTPWCVQVIRRATPRLAALLNVLLGVMLFLAVEDKPFFLYLIPSLAVLTYAYAGDTDANIAEDVRAVLAAVWPSVLVFLTLVGVYFFGTHTAAGDTYFDALVKAVKQVDLRSAFIAMLSYMTNFAKFSSMVYETGQFKLPNVFLSLAIWSWGLLFIWRALSTAPRVRRRILLTGLALILSGSTMLVARNAWTGHHFIYCLLLALLLVAQAVSRNRTGRTPFLVAYAATAVVLTAELPYLDPGKTWSWERYKVFEYLSRPEVARTHVIAHLSLGTYYVASLYGDAGQLSLQIEKLNAATASRIIDIADNVNRKVLCVCRGAGCDRDSLASGFQGRIVFDEVPLSNSEWRVFAETYRSTASTASAQAGELRERSLRQ